MDKSIVDISNLRPKHLQDYIGQENVKKTLKIFIDAVKKRGTATEHVLFYGPPGLGKTTLVYILANELQGDIKITSGAALQKSGDLAAILTNLKDNDVLFVDEIHRIPKPVEEMLYPVMEDNFLDIIIGKGPAARTVRLPIAKITIVGATTKLALLSAPLRDRFGLIQRLDYYQDGEMEQIILRSSKLLNLPITEEAAKEIAKRARKTPRIANRILKRARDIFEVDKHTEINSEVLTKLFQLLEIDQMGLDKEDRKYITLLATTFHNSPVGIETISSALSEDQQTVEDFIEPYLLQLGFLKRTPRGRVLTKEAYKHLGIPYRNAKNELEQNRLV